MWTAQTLRYQNDEVFAPRLDPHGRHRVVIFIHGFNNDKEQAEANYRALVDNLPRSELGVVDDIWQFFWPSFVVARSSTDRALSLDPSLNEGGAHSNTVLSAPTYSIQVGTAIKVGEALGRYCEKLGSAQVVFVAHSLGCRVVLETLKSWLDARKGRALPPDCHVACLMAAAVPVRRIFEGGDLRTAALATRVYVLYSPKDTVLQVWFRLGETGPFQGLAPQAVGTWGRPYDAWPRRADTRLGHSDYWQHRSAAPAVLHAVNRDSERELESRSIDLTWDLPTSPISRGRTLPKSRLERVLRWF